MITLSDNKNYVGWHSLVKFLLPRVMSVSLHTSTITGKSVCGVVLCGVVWCGLSLLLLHFITSVVFCYVLFHTFLILFCTYSFLRPSSISTFLSATLPLPLTLPSTSLHFDSFHFTLTSSLYNNPILCLILFVP
jgi:hypothetical protein